MSKIVEYVEKESIIFLIGKAMETNKRMNEDDMRVFLSGLPTIKVSEERKIIEED